MNPLARIEREDEYVIQATEEIRSRLRRTVEDIVIIGRTLIGVKERLGHGRFGEWLDAEFGWTDRAAQRFMQVASRFKSDIMSDLSITPTALYLLAAPSTPDEAFEQAIALAESGEKVTHKVAQEIVRGCRRAPVVEPPPLTGKYRVIYADPPWKYNDNGVIGNDNYGRAERHYPTLSIAQLCELPVKELAESNAVLFLWVTSPLLEESFKVIREWGFIYKTSFVWDKVKHNYGHYNSVRHEFLLVCTRGSCTPDVTKLFDSVQSVEKSAKHSEKPENFRHIIDTLYPAGDRIELFARRSHAKWDAWGNDAGE